MPGLKGTLRTPRQAPHCTGEGTSDSVSTDGPVPESSPGWGQGMKSHVLVRGQGSCSEVAFTLRVAQEAWPQGCGTRRWLSLSGPRPALLVPFLPPPRTLCRGPAGGSPPSATAGCPRPAPDNPVLLGHPYPLPSMLASLQGWLLERQEHSNALDHKGTPGEQGRTRGQSPRPAADARALT